MVIVNIKYFMTEFGGAARDLRVHRVFKIRQQSARFTIYTEKRASYSECVWLNFRHYYPWYRLLESQSS